MYNYSLFTLSWPRFYDGSLRNHGMHIRDIGGMMRPHPFFVTSLFLTWFSCEFAVRERVLSFSCCNCLLWPCLEEERGRVVLPTQLYIMCTSILRKRVRTASTEGFRYRKAATRPNWPSCTADMVIPPKWRERMFQHERGG